MFDADAWDEHRRKVRSALISFTAALHIHREQTIRAAKKVFGRGPEVQAVEKLFEDLRKASFEYGWLEEMRGALQHGDINAFKWGWGIDAGRTHGERVHERRIHARLHAPVNAEEVAEASRVGKEGSDPSVLDMIEAIQPLMGPLQEKLDKIMYPTVAQDVATVRELLSRFPGKRGLHALQNGPGYTRRNLWPPISPLAPRVLQLVTSPPTTAGANRVTKLDDAVVDSVRRAWTHVDVNAVCGRTAERRTDHNTSSTW